MNLYHLWRNRRDFYVKAFTSDQAIHWVERKYSLKVSGWEVLNYEPKGTTFETAGL